VKTGFLFAGLLPAEDSSTFDDAIDFDFDDIPNPIRTRTTQVYTTQQENGLSCSI
jgi:hypothetical protein